MSGITLLVEDPKWRSHRGLTARLTKAADAARRSARLKGAFTILLANDKKLRTFNHDFRGKDKPTNVLSFPLARPQEFTQAMVAGPELLLGDIVLARGVCVAEAADKGISVEHHATHLLVHGTLHLLGYDHLDDESAEDMEAREVRALHRLGIADPYKVAA